MSEQILNFLKNRLDDELSGYVGVGPDIKQNKIKEILQYHVLNFIYHHTDYSKWVMYGGSALRIIHGLDRMSVDLDFEISSTVTDEFLEEFKKGIEDYFVSTYSTNADFLVIKINTGRGLILKFNVGKELGLGHPSNQVHVKIDLNHFVAPKTVTERKPINRDQLSFAILTYNMGALMASKIAAILLRDQRGVNGNLYDYKGRDIYDLLWYMGKKIAPDFDYLNAKLKERRSAVPDIKSLFSKITVDIINYEKMDDCLKNDMAHLFENSFKFQNWFAGWRDSYLRLVDDYKIRTVDMLREAIVVEALFEDEIWFRYVYGTDDGKTVLVKYLLSDYWVMYEEGNLNIKIDENLIKITTFTSKGSSSHPASQDKLKQYATLFYQKTEDYFKKTNRVMLGDSIVTKVIRITASNFNPKEQIVLNKSALLSCELDDLLK